MRRGRAILLAAAAALLLAAPALAQTHSPFGVGISEGGGAGGGLTGWLLAEQAGLERQLAALVRATSTDPHAVWLLAALSFGYGVFHAAGPGHGKAVVAAYLFANEKALRRGLVLSSLAALLQGAVAVALVGVLTFALRATALQMRGVAGSIETLSFAGVALLGAWLVWRKGRLLRAALRARMPAPPALSLRPAAPALALRPATPALALATPAGSGAPAARPQRFQATAAAQDAAADCGHVHGPDPARLGAGFSPREAAATVAAAGLRPCSGAILVLVYAAAQGVFPTGIAAVAAMALGTALTTGTLAAVAVLAKGVALRVLRPGGPGGAVTVRALELAAAVLVLAVGLSLLLGSAAGLTGA